MATKSKTPDLDIDAVSLDVTERFDAVRWKNFNSSDMAARSETRTEVLDIRNDLMKVAAVDPSRASVIWDEHVPSYVPRPLELPTTEPEPLVLNTIEPGRRRRRAISEPFLEPAPSAELGAADMDREGARPTSKSVEPAQMVAQSSEGPLEDPAAARARLLLEGLNRQYLRADDKYHFRDRGGKVAFEAQDRKLLTQHETPPVVTSMIDLADARGWSSLKLSGTSEFRREAWLQASLRDFETSGYKPTQIDIAKRAEIRAQRAASILENSISVQAGPAGGKAVRAAGFGPLAEDGKSEPEITLTPAQAKFIGVMEATMRHRGDAPEAIRKALELGTERLRSDRIYVGTLVEIGTAPYQDKRGERTSHFITLQDEAGGMSKVWGVGLPRALEASGAEKGQKLAVVFRGRQPVTIDVPPRDGKGQTAPSGSKQAERNTWEIVQFDRLRDEAKTSIQTAILRQGNPAELKVFDRSVVSTARGAMAPVDHNMRRDRSV